MVRTGRAAAEFLPPEAKVIAPYGGDTTFLYQTQRQGWPVGIEIEKMIGEGATHYVNFNFDAEVEWLSGNYCVLQRTPEYIIIDLARKCQS